MRSARAGGARAAIRPRAGRPLRRETGVQRVVQPGRLPQRRGRGDGETIRGPHDGERAERHHRRMSSMRRALPGPRAEAPSRDRRDRARTPAARAPRTWSRRRVRAPSRPRSARPQRRLLNPPQQREQREQERRGEGDVGRRQPGVSEDAGMQETRPPRSRPPPRRTRVARAPTSARSQRQKRQDAGARQPQVAYRSRAPCTACRAGTASTACPRDKARGRRRCARRAG